MDKYYYSKTANGFFINIDTAPEDSAEITAERWGELLDGQSKGKYISSDSAGYPVLVDPPPPTHEELIAVAEGHKSSLMLQANNTIAPLQDAVDLGMATNEESQLLIDWKKYRVLLMRVDTAKPVWPIPPGWQAN
ncbi:tail fiber assembly protein [Escherichia coli]|uniref:tail fiber assembly protein n=1 Tax=Escherichia coli TaxID=562 RepID=UPI0010CB12FC|nr:tail fiber assembly protein [Escherichia coli]EFM3971977.1 tail fiber assembly protein [Escherichia coli]MBL9241927.1 tail fiber assembly protein [Escherichia coli]GCN06919.1 phage tail fiber assembly protein [Escherichia coli]